MHRRLATGYRRLQEQADPHCAGRTQRSAAPGRGLVRISDDADARDGIESRQLDESLQEAAHPFRATEFPNLRLFLEPKVLGECLEEVLLSLTLNKKLDGLLDPALAAPYSANLEDHGVSQRRWTRAGSDTAVARLRNLAIDEEEIRRHCREPHEPPARTHSCGLSRRPVY